MQYENLQAFYMLSYIIDKKLRVTVINDEANR